MLLNLLLDFPGEVLRNQTLRLATVADPGLAGTLSLARRTVLALDADYRAIGLNGAPEAVRSFVDFCDRQSSSPFRFRPSSTTGAFECTPSDFAAATAFRSALRCASALVPAVMGGFRGRGISSTYRRDSRSYEQYGDTVIHPKKGADVPFPRSADAVFRDLFDFHGFFSLDIRESGRELEATLWDSAWSASLEMARSPGHGTDLCDCFVIIGQQEGDGGPVRPSDPAAFENSVHALEALVPRAPEEKIVLVIDDTHGDALDFGVHVFAGAAIDLLGPKGIEGLRESIRDYLCDFCEGLGLTESDSVDDETEEESEGSDDAGAARIRTRDEQRLQISRALDQIHLSADPVFSTESDCDEFDSRIAAFRAGQLIAFRADQMEMQPVAACASLRRTT